MDRQDIQANKFYAALSYWGILILVPLLFKRDSKFTRFHVNQGLVILFGVLVFELACRAMKVLLGRDSTLDVFIICLIWAIDLFFIVLKILGTIYVIKGETKPLPLIGQFQILKS